MTKQYSIGELSSLTGVKPITLRAWERRYGLVVPERTESGHRVYNDEHVKLVREIRFWLDKGIAISKVEPYLSSTHDEDSDVNSLFTDEIQSIINAVVSFDQATLSMLLDDLISLYPFDTIIEMFLPSIHEVLKMHSLDSDAAHAESSFFYLMLKQKLRQFIADQSPKKDLLKLLITKTAGQYDRLDLLLLGSFLIVYGYDVLIIEIPVDLTEAKAVMAQSNRDCLLLFSSHEGPDMASAKRLDEELSQPILVVTEEPAAWRIVPEIQISQNKLDHILQALERLQ